MNIFKKLVKWFLKIAPYNFLIKNYHKLIQTKLADIVNSVLYERFFKESKIITDFDNYIQKIKRNKKYYVIKEGLYKYRICNFCFLKDMMSIMIWCLENEYFPIIEIYPDSEYYAEKSNLWEMYFNQPFVSLDKVKRLQYKEIKLTTRITSFAVRVNMADVNDDMKVKLWHKLFSKLIVPNERTMEYFDNEYNSILKGKKVVGCVVRGTDYTKLKPKSHPKQPEISELVEKLKQFIGKDGYEYIYLATEEKRIADAIKREFPGKVLENKRCYFDEKYFSDKNSDMVSKVHFDRDNDDYLKMLEYMSSINLVSKCDALVAGLCGGSEISVYWNGLKYSEKYLFDKGLY